MSSESALIQLLSALSQDSLNKRKREAALKKMDPI